MKTDYLKSPFKTFYFALYPYRGRFVAIIVLIILGNICSYSMPLFLRLIVDKVTAVGGTASFSDLFPIFLLLASALLCQELFFRTGHIIETYTVPNTFSHITESLYEGLIKRPASYFENKFSGDLGRRIEQVGASVVFFCEFPWEAGWVCLSIVMAAIVLSTTHIYIFWTFIGWLVFFIGTTIPLVIWHHKASEKVAFSHASLSGSVIDTLSNVSLMHAFGGVPYEQELNQKAIGAVVKAERKMRWIFILNKFQNGISVAGLGASLIYVSIYLFSRGEFSVGQFVLVAAVFPTLIGVIWSFGEFIVRVSRQHGELSNAVASLQKNQQQLVGGNVSMHESKQYPIEFKNVFFQYQGTSGPVFNDLSLHINQGERVGIVGSSGAGKSTLVKLLLRQHEFSTGDISIAGTPIRDFSLRAFYKLISYVPQDTSLFHRSLLDNIRYAKIDATKDEVLEASKRANADEFIKTFPNGYETLVGERGVKLSGGQRQRIALARAILKNAPILILDEATSSLDTESETSIQNALSELFKDRTVIAIAHRLSTLRAMDRIVVLENGAVVESGQPQELLKNDKSIFKRMWDLQKDGFIE